MSITNQSDLENKKLRETLKKRENDIQLRKEQIAEKDEEIRKLHLDLQNAKTVSGVIKEKDELISKLKNDLNLADGNQIIIQEHELIIRQLKMKEASDQQKYLDKENEVNKLKVDIQNVIHKELKEKNLKIQKLRDSLNSVEIERDGLQQVNLEKTDAYDQLKTSLTTLQSDNLRNQEISVDLIQAKNKIRELEEIIAKCQAVLFTDSETDQIFDRMKATKIQNKSLKLENLNLVDENEKFQEERHEMQRRFREFEIEIAKTGAGKEDLKVRIGKLEGELNEAKDQISSFIRMLDEASQYKELYSLLEMKYENLKRTNEDSKKIQEQTEYEIQAIRRNRKKTDQKLSALQQQVDGLEKENVSLKKKISEAEDREKDLKVLNKETLNELHALQDSNMGLLDKLSKLQAEIQKIKNNN